MSSVDEEALNALAVSLNQADEQARKGRIYADAANFHNAQTKKLEQQNSGMKRWGTQWLPAEEADAKTTAWNKAVASSTKLGRDLAALKAHMAMVERNQNDPVFMQRAADSELSARKRFQIQPRRSDQRADALAAAAGG